MAKRKKHQHHEEHVDESWLIPYADLLTLLLALFIVLFASSSIDAKKFEQMSNVFNQVFNGGTGVMDYEAPVPDPSSSSADKQEKTAETFAKDDDGKGNFGQQEQKELAEIQARVNQYIQKNQLTDRIGTNLTEEGLLLTIRDNVLFESGSAEVKEIHKGISKEISELLVMDPPRNIVISGHTDNVPIETYQFRSNWDLSVMRAVNFMKIMLENKKLDPVWFSATGFGEFKPIASNDTASGKSNNRRVEVLIKPRTPLDNS
ncbi:flagellar motor protein MotB [Peribacillus saganii]|uniref:Flagellar motor protein MotB n=1 Tax=Peribacillus saganii TaxID=2303992 RepID=A0A372LLT1_9BACI|nr:flagellar motor protein MotB [Peribacillus saganii]RFU67928.1 flagellar motor protein MotB [Peribacillus saganii]